MGNFIGQSKETQVVVKTLHNAYKAKRIPLLLGEPGTGKTALVEAFCEELSMPLVVVIGSTMDPTDMAGLPVIKTLDDGTTITENACPWWLYRARENVKKHGACAVFFDEITTVAPAVQAPMLTTFQSRIVGGHTVPDEVFIIAAGNPPEQAADGWLLAPPMANRLSHIPYKPSRDDWFTGMTVAWNNEVSKEELAARQLIVAYLRQHPDAVQVYPDTLEEAAGAWPSMRTWDNTATMLAHSDPTDAGERLLTLTSNVGNKVGASFLAWEKALKVPPYEEVIAAPERLKWEAFRADALHLILSSVLGNMTVENMKESVNVFAVASEKKAKFDVCASMVSPLITKVRELCKAASIDMPKLMLARVLKEYGDEVAEALKKV